MRSWMCFKMVLLKFKSEDIIIRIDSSIQSKFYSDKQKNERGKL